MSILLTESHPAFYHSKKRIWDFPIIAPPSRPCNKSLQSKLNAYFVGGLDSLWKFWYSLFVVTSTCWISWLAILRYQEFKTQAFNPRFGLSWDWIFPTNLQVAGLVAVVSCFPLLVYSSLSRVGHSANDGIILGRDCLHLHAMLAQLPCFRLAQRSADPEAAERLRSRIARSTQSLNEPTASPDFESFILQDRTENLETGLSCVTVKRQLRPFACLIHVLTAFALLLPVCIFEAEQIKNEAIPPQYVWHSNLDWLVRGFRLPQDEQMTVSNNSIFKVFKSEFPADTSEAENIKESYSSFPRHPYPYIPTDLGAEYVLLATTLVVLTIRFAAPFWFTSRSFSTLLSVYTAITGGYILLEAASMELLIKIYTAGSRDLHGIRVDAIPPDCKLLRTWVFVVASVSGFLALLVGLTAFYSFGESLFQKSVTNYANLIMAGEFEANAQKDMFTTEEKNSTIFEHIAGEENDLLGPSVVAVTTKVWRPSHRNQLGNSSLRATTPSGLSASSDTLRTKTACTATSPPSIIGKSTDVKAAIAFWPSVTSGLAFICLVVTRSCLFGPMLQCFWYTQVKLPLIFVVFSIVYMILWLIIWFGVTFKTSWRFRLLHMPSSSRSRFTSPKHRLHAERLGLGAAQFAPWPLMSNPAAAQLGASFFWPWLQYQNGGVGPAPNGSLGFGGSSMHCERTYADRVPSGPNSVYGCYMDARQSNPGGQIREGPSTLSDESDVIQMEYEGSSNYAYLQKGAGLITTRDVDKASQDISLLYRGNMGDPTYASLASLGRVASPQRSQVGSRRGAPGARVTFKSDDNRGIDANNGSSDSGVYTNGSGNRTVEKLNATTHPHSAAAVGGNIDGLCSGHAFVALTEVGTMPGLVRLENDDRLCSQV